MDRELDRTNHRPGMHESAQADDWQAIELTPTEWQAIVRLLARSTLLDLRRHATNDEDALRMQVATSKLLLGLRHAGY